MDPPKGMELTPDSIYKKLLVKDYFGIQAVNQAEATVSLTNKSMQLCPKTTWKFSPKKRQSKLALG